MDDNTLAATRRSLHGVAELLIAGPQYREYKTIRLCVTPGGFGGTTLPVRIDGTELVWPGGRAPLSGSSADLGALANLDPGLPEGLYADTSGVAAAEPLTITPDAVALILGWFANGDAALRSFAPSEEPVLWPEHFDLGISFGEVNYGVSPGDSAHPRPYAYIGPWTSRTGAFWNQPFGASRSVDELSSVESLAEFFAEGQREAAV